MGNNKISVIVIFQNFLHCIFIALSFGFFCLFNVMFSLSGEIGISVTLFFNYNICLVPLYNFWFLLRLSLYLVSLGCNANSSLLH